MKVFALVAAGLAVCGALPQQMINIKAKDGGIKPAVAPIPAANAQAPVKLQAVAPVPEQKAQAPVKADPKVVTAQPVKPFPDPKGLVFDLGFHNGADSKYYLSQGYKVVAIEADPTKVEAAKAMFWAEIASGDFKIENVGLATVGADQELAFFKSKVNTEWNSFHSAVACRAPLDAGAPADWPKSGPFPTCPMDKVDCSAYCEKIQVHTSTCASLLKAHGQPDYMKIDIEGMEGECLKSLTPDKAPRFLSVEDCCVDQMIRLGYTKFKVVNQKDSPEAASGVWGEDAMDFEVGKAWRDVAALKVWEVKYHPDGYKTHGDKAANGKAASSTHARLAAARMNGATFDAGKTELVQSVNSTIAFNVNDANMWFDIHAMKW